MWENLRVIVISSIMTLLILGSLIWAGVIPLQQQPNTYQTRFNMMMYAMKKLFSCFF